MYRRNPQQSSPASSPRKGYGEGIAFFNHFHKAFLRPYGKAESSPDVGTIMNRINSRNCEWLCRPQVALSELSDSIRTNVPIIEASPLINGDELGKVLHSIAKLSSAMLPFERTSTSVPTEDEATDLLELSIDQQSELDSFWSNAFELGGALMTSSLNYIVFRDLLRNPTAYADKLTATDKHSTFKSTANLADFRDVLLQGRSAATDHGTNAGSFAQLVAQLRPPTSGPAPSPTPRPTPQKRPLDAIDSDTEETLSPVRKKKKGKRHLHL